mmetsp:Transcript_89087/g.276870  ORF Transcript_89087/g.276870 Transcript_89087/m.276870 type:complete len:373 (+) Transcript_89087:90-1208(+)
MQDYQQDFVMCSPVLSLPRGTPMFTTPPETMAWRGRAEGQFFIQQSMQPYTGPVQLGVQSMGTAWDCYAGSASAAPPILSTSPKKNRKQTGDGAVLPFLQQQGQPCYSWTPVAAQQQTPAAADLAPLEPLELPKHDDPQIELGEEVTDLYGGSDSPVRIRNTFLDSPLERSPSLERFFAERKVRSCPASGPNSRQASGRSTPNPGAMQDPFSIKTPSVSAVVTPRGGIGKGASLRGAEMKQYDLAVIAAAKLVEAADCGAAGGAGADSSSASSTSAGNVPYSGQVSEASGSGAISLSQPPAATDASSRTVGPAELPSKGSALHPWGACKPCAFVFEVGCTNGVNCQFCHLCEPGEKKRRKKERRRMAKDLQN